MRLYIDLDTRGFVESDSFPRPVASLAFKRRDVVPVEVRFVRGNAVQELADGAAGKIGIKPKGQYGSPFYLAFGSGWTKSGTGAAAAYSFPLSLATAEIESAFLAEPETVPAMLEVEWVEDGLRTSSATLDVEIQNDVNRGNEGVPSGATPEYPLPAELELLARKGQPGGYAGLDGDGKLDPSQLPGGDAPVLSPDQKAAIDASDNPWVNNPFITASALQWNFQTATYNASTVYCDALGTDVNSALASHDLMWAGTEMALYNFSTALESKFHNLAFSVSPVAGQSLLEVLGEVQGWNNNFPINAVRAFTIYVWCDQAVMLEDPAVNGGEVLAITTLKEHQGGQPFSGLARIDALTNATGYFYATFGCAEGGYKFLVRSGADVADLRASTVNVTG